MTTIINAVCALIPDGLEQWLAHGGNVVVVLAALAVLAARAVLAPPRPAPQSAAPADGWVPADEVQP